MNKIASNDALVGNIPLNARLRHHHRQLLPFMDILPVTDLTANVLQGSVQFRRGKGNTCTCPYLIE